MRALHQLEDAGVPVGDIDEAVARHFPGGLGNASIAFDPASPFENAGALAIDALGFPSRFAGRSARRAYKHIKNMSLAAGGSLFNMA